MFRHFAEVDLDVALVEVGLGGRLDATNAWDGGVAVLTNVGLDHTDRLGPTIAHIAREKAAIVKRGDVAVTGTDGEALAILRRRCARLGVPLAVAAPAPILGWSRDAVDAGHAAPRCGGGGAPRPPPGLQRRGRGRAAGCARAGGDRQRAAGGTAPGLRRRALAGAPGAGHGAGAGSDVPCEVLLDGAHNPDGARALAQALDDLRPHLVGGGEAPPVPVTLVWASMADKDVEGVVAAVAVSRVLPGATIVCTALDLPRAMPAADLAAIWRAALPTADVRDRPDPDEALDLAIAMGRGPVVVAGSLYLVGAARARLVDDPALRDPDAP